MKNTDGNTTPKVPYEFPSNFWDNHWKRIDEDTHKLHKLLKRVRIKTVLKRMTDEEKAFFLDKMYLLTDILRI